MSKIILCASVFYLVASRNIKAQADQLVIEIPKECPAKGDCTLKPKGYEEIVAKIEKLLPGYYYFKQNYTDRYGDALGPPVRHDENYQNNCPDEVSTQVCHSYDGHVLAQTPTIKQYVEVVECIPNNRTVGKQCFNDVMEVNQVSSCQTIHKTYILYKLSDGHTAIVPEAYDIPACCSCVILI